MVGMASSSRSLCSLSTLCLSTLSILCLLTFFLAAAHGTLKPSFSHETPLTEHHNVDQDRPDLPFLETNFESVTRSEPLVTSETHEVISGSRVNFDTQKNFGIQKSFETQISIEGLNYFIPEVGIPSQHENAYLAMQYCGTARDYEFFVATRVLLAGLREQRVEADLAVLVSLDCPQPWLDLFKSDGNIVIPVPDLPNPYAHQAKFNSRFSHSLNKLYAWRLLQYRRVVMIDADNIFLRNTDELFQCGDFCAAFIDPCIFHTGLFVLKPSNETFFDILDHVGKIGSLDGGDQGFLVNYYSDMLNAPIFRAPRNGTILNGRFRLHFGYQMDTSYYYFRMKWRVPCGDMSVMTFPGAEQLKPWYWWSWPLLPLGLVWHNQRLRTVGYSDELVVIISQALVYLSLLLSLYMRQEFICTERTAVLKTCVYRYTDPFHVLFSVKFSVSIYLVFSLLLPFVVVPTTIHPILGWGLYFLGVFSMFSLLGAFMIIKWVPLLTPFFLLVINWLNMALPIYHHGLPRFLSIGILASLSTPSLWWAYCEIMGGVGRVMEEPLMGRVSVRVKV